MIKRERYLAKIRPFYDSDLVKVITSIRRSGKSVILNQIRDEIKNITDNIIYLNFERTADFMKASDAATLIKYVNANKKAGKCYIFLDEVQEVEDWQVAVKDLRLDNNSIFITGNNSTLLSSEILALLSGRFVSFKIETFVYLEIKEYMDQLGRESSVTDYLIWGGFPGRLAINSLEAQKDYLYDLKNTIVYNDLIKRYNIRKTVIFKKIVNFILMSNARIISARSIYKYVNNAIGSVSLTTVLKYIEYLKEAYIIKQISQYSAKTKKELAYYYKLYNTDVCFNSLSVINNRFDLDHNLENIVYNELIYREYTVKVYDNNGKEIDFYAVKDNKEYYIQVAYSVVNEKAYDREFSAFENLSHLAQKIIITTDEIDFSTSVVRHITLKSFLHMNDFTY